MSPTPPSGASPAKVLTIKGALAIQTAADWKTHFAEQFDSGAPLAVDLTEVTLIDVFGLQLLLALRRSAVEEGRPLSFSSIPAPVHEACAAAGLAAGTLFTSIP